MDGERVHGARGERCGRTEGHAVIRAHSAVERGNGRSGNRRSCWKTATRGVDVYNDRRSRAGATTAKQLDIQLGKSSGNRWRERLSPPGRAGGGEAIAGGAGVGFGEIELLAAGVPEFDVARTDDDIDIGSRAGGEVAERRSGEAGVWRKRRKREVLDRRRSSADDDAAR